MSKRDDELVSAYVDGVGELSLEERRRIEATLADDPALRDDAEATRALLGQLRDLPDEGAEPDWLAMERAIRAEVGPDAPVRWWGGWKWLAPIAALAMSGAVLALVLRGTDPAPHHEPVALPVYVPTAAPSVAPASTGTVALWLDGAAVEIDDASADALLAPDEEVDDATDPGILSGDDLAWVDDLGEDEVAAAEAWLARKKS